MTERVNGRAVAVAIAVVLLAATFFLVRGGEETRTVSAHFPRAVSVFKGTDVRVLGVNVGKVTAVVPEGNSVRVEMEYDARHRVPAGAKAVVVTPTLVADRFVQLTPAFTEGDQVMADGADIPLPDTAVPVELDRIYSALRDLTRALGPNGANADGTLNHLMTVAAQNLEGRGAQGNQMLRDLSRAAETFGEGSGDLFRTVRNLAEFTEVVANNDRLVRAFLKDLAAVSADLAGERVELQRALTEVARAVGTVRTFVRDNREALVTDLEKLTRVMRTIASEKDSLDRALRVAPVGIGNLNAAFDAESGSIGSRVFAQGNIGDADGFLCSVVQQTDLPRASKDLACRVFEMVIEPAGSQVYENSGSTAPAPEQPGQTQARFSTDTSSSLSDLTGGR
jgi:phospholipid/cholesterol/gamma-HCH transport system substrate-binding protein